MTELFDMRARSRRRDRAARHGVEMFIYDRVFEDCFERIELTQRQYERALLIGCPSPGWSDRLGTLATEVHMRDPGAAFASQADGQTIIEDAWEPVSDQYDLVLAIGTLDSVNDLRLALRLTRYAMRADGLFIGALSGGDTLPQLRSALRAADVLSGGAAPHVHPRIEAAAVAPLLAEAGFIQPVVDIDRVQVSYSSLDRLVTDLRRMGVTNMLTARPKYVGRASREAAMLAFSAAGNGSRTDETFEILHFAAWTPPQCLQSR